MKHGGTWQMFVGKTYIGSPVRLSGSEVHLHRRSDAVAKAASFEGPM